jgi:hypothetical protein
MGGTEGQISQTMSKVVEKIQMPFILGGETVQGSKQVHIPSAETPRLRGSGVLLSASTCSETRPQELYPRSTGPRNRKSVNMQDLFLRSSLHIVFPNFPPCEH